MRVRIARSVHNSASLDAPGSKAALAANEQGYDTNIFNDVHLRNGVRDGDGGSGEAKGEKEVTAEEQRVLDRVAEDLARLGRVKRVGLGVQEKIEFVKLWRKRKH
jgi:hypothetical protein